RGFLGASGRVHPGGRAKAHVSQEEDRRFMRVLENFINGAWVSSSGTTLLDVKNPATGELLAKVPLSTSADVDAAVQAAKAAFPAWRAIPPVQRARYLFKLKS